MLLQITRDGILPIVGLVLVVMSTSEAEPARAQSAPPRAQIPDLMKLPGIINLGATTFRDGFLPTNPDCAYFQYLRRNSWNEIHDKNGKDVAAFKDLEIDVTGAASQLACTTPVKILGGALGFHTIVPIAELQSSADPSGIVLQDSGFGFGDIFIAAYLQMPPVMRNGQPIYSQRFDLTFISPAGKFDSGKDLNQSSGYWSVNPYWAGTWFLAQKWELTWRAHYLYNFETSKIPTSLIPNVRQLFKNGQAGQATWVNFTLGYAVTQKFSVGLTGYYLRQLTDDELNGHAYDGGKEEALYMGPGFHYDFNPKNAMNINVYLPVEDKNRPSEGVQFNLVYGHIF
jgi:hypothetical protein